MSNETMTAVQKEEVHQGFVEELTAYFGEPLTYGEDGDAFFVLFGDNLQEGRSFWSQKSLADAASSAMFAYVKEFNATRKEWGQ